MVGGCLDSADPMPYMRVCVCMCTLVHLSLFAITAKDLCNMNKNGRSQDLNGNLIFLSICSVFCISCICFGRCLEMEGVKDIMAIK